MTNTETDVAEDSSGAVVGETVAAPLVEAEPVEAPAPAAAPVPDVVPEPAATPSAEPVVEVESAAVEEVAVPEVVPEATPVAEKTQPEPMPDPGEIAPSASHGAGPASVSTQAPTPTPTPTSTVSSILKLGLEKIRFRKRAKLEKIIALAREKGSITNDDVQLAVQVSHATATRYLNQLVIAGRLRRSGPSEHATYEPV